jgi:proteic killer suppression protein
LLFLDGKPEETGSLSTRDNHSTNARSPSPAGNDRTAVLPGAPPVVADNARRYHPAVIRSFNSEDTRRLWERHRVRRFVNFERVAQRKLAQLDGAAVIEDLKIPPGNHLEKLQGDRAGQWSIRINDQWRMCFRFENGDALDVEIVDYH